MIIDLRLANIQWRNKLPYSIDFNDIYFNTEDGLQETDYVFIAHNQLQQRFSNLNQNINQNFNFTIIETGFGTGLNFLAISVLWLKLAPKNATLHYIGIEKTPLSITDLTRAHSLWPQFSAISTELLIQYPKLQAGTNQFSIATGHIQLGLQADDIASVLPNIKQKTDAWLLDGFAPAKNSAMWTNEVFAQMARLSKTGATFATFTSAGHVKRGLQAAGFEVSKHKGFGKKCEMLAGYFAGH